MHAINPFIIWSATFFDSEAVHSILRRPRSKYFKPFIPIIDSSKFTPEYARLYLIEHLSKSSIYILMPID
jgi:hypothetical protein